MNQGTLLELPHADDSPASRKAKECTDLDMANLNIDAETGEPIGPFFTGRILIFASVSCFDGEFFGDA